MKTQDQLFGKLNTSIYRKNIKEVWNVLEQYPKECRKTFLKNIKSLEFKHFTKEQLQELAEDIDVNGLYIPTENKIYLNGFENKQEEINHELFHVASCTPKYWGIIVDISYDNKIRTIGDNLNEGITEYLAFISSDSKDISNSAYQLEVFVIETLINIYGTDILKPYFQNNPPKFYSQFRYDEQNIIKLDILLKKISNWISIRNSFEEYIVLKDIAKNKLEKNHLDSNTSNMKELSKHLKKYEFEINELFEEVEQEERKKGNTSQMYTLKKEKELYLNWYYMYDKIQKEIFEKLLKILIVLARTHNLSDEWIKDILIKNLENKKTILSTIEYKNKKLIRK